VYQAKANQVKGFEDNNQWKEIHAFKIPWPSVSMPLRISLRVYEIRQDEALPRSAAPTSLMF
jgi:hypothetical protein